MHDQRPPPEIVYPFHWRGADAALWLAAPQPGGDVVDRALALEPLLPLTSALEVWLGEPLLVAAAQGAAHVPALGDLLPIEIGAANDAVLCTIALPAARLAPGLGAALPAPWALRWPRVVCDLVLDDWPLEAIVAQRLEPGAMLLLPRSFGAERRAWAVPLEPVALQPRLSPAHRVARWHADEHVVRVEPQAASPMAPPRPWRAVLPHVAAPRADVWCGLATQTEVLRVDADRIELRLHGRTVANGRLAPAGGGFGVLIEPMVRSADAATA